MRKIIFSLVICTVILLNISAMAADKQELTISAAASLTDSLKEIAPMFETKHPNTKIYFNFAASGVLVRQIEQGAPADVFISAAIKQVDQLDSKGLLLPGSRKNILSSDMALIVPKNSKLNITSFDDLKKNEVQRIVIGNPDFVPAGQYAKEILSNLGVFDNVADKTIYGEDVRQVLNYVARGEVDAGIVFSTDTMIMPDKIRVVFLAPQNSHKPIVYPAAVIKTSGNPELSKEFIDFLSSREAQTIFKKYGFRNF